MSVKYFLVLLASMLISFPLYADEDMSSDNKPCMAVVKQCLKAGYNRHGSEGKQFWHDCMKPILLDKTVKDVTVDAEDVKACRTAKINEMEKETAELKAVK